MTRRHGMNPRMGLSDFSAPELATEPLGHDPASIRANVLRMACVSSETRQRAGRDTSLPPELGSRVAPFGRDARNMRREFDRQQAARVAARKAEREKLANYTNRDPCVRCGVRADRHDVYGCGRPVL